MANLTGKGTFQQGQSGNPKGRPKKGRALTELLEKQFSKTITLPDGKRVQGKKYVAERALELATIGETTLGNGRVIEVSALGVSWYELVKWIYAQIDGPPKTETNLTLKGGISLGIVEEVVNADADHSPAPGTEGVP